MFFILTLNEKKKFYVIVYSFNNYFKNEIKKVKNKLEYLF